MQSSNILFNNNKIAILADIHSNYFLLKKVLKDIETKGIQNILFLGDYITDGFENNEVLNLLKNYCHIISGNRECSIANYNGNSWNNSEQFKNMLYTYNNLTNENLNFIKTLPAFKIIILNNKKICLSHGTPFNNRDIVNYNSYDIFNKLIDTYNCDIYLSAHTHEAFYTNYENKVFINPGSVVSPADKAGCKYGILDLDTMVYEQIIISCNFSELRNYYLNSDYFIQNKEWCNLIIHTNEKGCDYFCAFIDFIKEKAIKDNIDIKNSIPNTLWHTAFFEFMKLHKLHIYS